MIALRVARVATETHARELSELASNQWTPGREAQDFHVDEANQTCVADITCVWTAQCRCYLTVVLHLFSRRVVGWAFDDHMRVEVPLKALERALLESVSRVRRPLSRRA